MRANSKILIPNALSRGIIASTMTPFDEEAAIIFGTITEQAQRITSIDGVLGVAVNTTARERLCITMDERLEIIRRTRAGLDENQLLLSCTGALSEKLIEDVYASKGAGAHAIIACLPHSYQNGETHFHEHLTELFDRMPLPVILSLGRESARWTKSHEEITVLAAGSNNIHGFDMGSSDNVLQYDRCYYAIKSLDRPIACLSSSDGALFHNLNTGGDGVLSCLGSIAPYEVADLYRASRAGCFSEAQAIHNRLAPLVALLTSYDGETHELLYREAAYHRGLLASPYARGITKPLCPDLRNELHKTIADIGIKIAC